MGLLLLTGFKYGTIVFQSIIPYASNIFLKIAFCKNGYISLRGAMTSFTLGHLLEWPLNSLGTKFGGVTINGECMGNKYFSCAIFTCG